MNIEYNVQVWKEEDQFIAHATPIDVASSGKTPDKAKAALEEALRLFLATAREAGTLEQVLEESGYEYSHHSWTSPTWIAMERRSSRVAA